MSLTKEALLEGAKDDPPHLLGEFFGHKVFVKPMSELKRSRRLAGMFDDDGKLKPAYLERARVYAITDHVCDEEGNNLYSDKDVPDLLNLSCEKIEPLHEAIKDWIEGNEGNE